VAPTFILVEFTQTNTVDRYASETGIPIAAEKATCPPIPERHKADAPTHGNAQALGIIGYLAKDADLRNLRRLAKIGRRKYALELVAKDQASPRREKLVAPDARAFVDAPSVNTAATAESTPERTYQKGYGKWENLPPMEVQKQAATVWDERSEWSPLWRTLTPRSARFRWEHPKNERNSGNNPKLRLVALTQAAGIQRETQTHSSTRPWDDVHRIDRSDGRTNRQTSRGSS
jgi:hypothetical protein